MAFRRNPQKKLPSEKRWRRNRTISNVSSPKPVRRHEKLEQKAYRKKIWRGLFALLAVIILVYLYIAHGLVNTIEMMGEYSPETAQKANQLVKRNIFSRTKLFINQAELINELKSFDSAISQVEVSLPVIGTTIRIDIQSRQPFARWKEDKSDTNLAVDTKGILFVADKPLPDGLPTISDSSAIEPAIGDLALLPGYVQFISEFESALSLSHLFGGPNRLEHSYEVPASSRELDIKFAGKPYLVKLLITRSAEDQITELTDLTDYLTSNGITPKQYIDLRVDNRAYYK